MRTTVSGRIRPRLGSRTCDLEDVLEAVPVLRPSEVVHVHDPVLNRSASRVLQHGIARTGVDGFVPVALASGIRELNLQRPPVGSGTAQSIQTVAREQGGIEAVLEEPWSVDRRTCHRGRERDAAPFMRSLLRL